MRATRLGRELLLHGVSVGGRRWCSYVSVAPVNGTPNVVNWDRNILKCLDGDIG